MKPTVRKQSKAGLRRATPRGSVSGAILAQAAILVLVLTSNSALPATSASAQERRGAPAYGGVAGAIGPGTAPSVDAFVEAALPDLRETYEHLHAHPELSLQESETAAFAARALKADGFKVLTEVGGHGVVGILRNGSGPTVLVRGDTDGLPVTEATGLAYASRARATNAAGDEVGTMHACGHDVHVTSVLGAARFLSEARSAWTGTLVILAQPAEEIGRGALMMLEDGLLDRIPKPDFGISLHVEDTLESGRVAVVPGFAAANVDSVEITVFGRGGHGARPHRAIDPIVTSAHLVTALQTVVSRRIKPGTPAVITVGSIHGGAKNNVIPDEVRLALTVRSYSDEVRTQLLDGIRDITESTCLTFGCPKPPEIAIKQDYTPAMYNDPELTEFAEQVFRDRLGADAVTRMEPSMGGEDFGRYSRAGGFPTLQYRLGAVSGERLAESRRPGGAPLPSLHSSLFAPDADRTLRTGVVSLSHLALELFRTPLAR